MRHDPFQEILHDMHCGCPRCRNIAERPLVEPEDIEAMRRGLIGGVLLGSVFVFAHFWPAILAWFAS